MNILIAIATYFTINIAMYVITRDWDWPLGYKWRIVFVFLAFGAPLLLYAIVIAAYKKACAAVKEQTD